jgi:hypothetical protein
VNVYEATVRVDTTLELVSVNVPETLRSEAPASAAIVTRPHRTTVRATLLGLTRFEDIYLGVDPV